MVLMVDDDDDALEIYTMLVQKTEHARHFITYNNGLDALDYLKNTREDGHSFPSYILLDLNMPGLGGVDFIEEYEKLFLEDHPETEIFILTSSVREKDNEEALSYTSVSRFINKPLSRENLIKLIAKSSGKEN
ncbi:MAG: response regulator [Cyclobacteriaceae bacterium]